MDIFKYILVFWAGLAFGIIVCWWLLPRLKSYDGIIRVVPGIEDKIVYSLVLYEDPENILFAKELLFKIETSVENGNRT